MTTSAEKLRLWKDHPVAMVRDLFAVEPDAWQVEALEAFPDHPQQAFKAAKGCGKSTCLAWMCWNFLLTRPHAKVGAVSITRDNLADGLWAEMSKWQQRAPVLAQAFTWQRDRIFCNDAPSTWFMSAKSYAKDASSEQQANTLAGFHADYVMFVLDEVGGMSDAVMVAAEAARSGCIECHIVAAGNPTHLSGPLYRAATVDRGKPWWVAEITGDPEDPKRSSRIPMDWAAEQIARYGRDNPFVMVNVLGQFPPSSLNALIGPEEVEEAMSRSWREDDIRTAPRILGVDVAQFGDDASAIVLRRGLQAFKPRQERNLSSTDGAAVVADEMRNHDPDAVFIDSTGGYGAGWIDRLRELGHTTIGVNFSGKAMEAERYFNKRAEMYLDAVEWIRRGGALWRSPRLKEALVQTTYSFKGGRLLLEPKEQIKGRLGYSPDEADALALTFAAPVASRDLPRRPPRQMQVEYDPFRSITDAMDRTGGTRPITTPSTIKELGSHVARPGQRRRLRRNRRRPGAAPRPAVLAGSQASPRHAGQDRCRVAQHEPDVARPRRACRGTTVGQGQRSPRQRAAARAGHVVGGAQAPRRAGRNQGADERTACGLRLPEWPRLGHAEADRFVRHAAAGVSTRRLVPLISCAYPC